MCSLKLTNTFQVTALFRGGSTTLLREAIGNAVFFSVYEHVRYYMRLHLKSTSFDHNHLIDMGIGIVTGGLGGVAVSSLTTIISVFFLCFTHALTKFCFTFYVF